MTAVDKPTGPVAPLLKVAPAAASGTDVTTAATLDATTVLAGHIERDDEAVDPQTRLAAVSLARSLIRSYPAPTALTEEGPA